MSLSNIENKQSNERIAMEAASWIAQLDGNRLSTSDRIALAEWISRSPKHAEEINRLAMFWGGIDSLIDESIIDNKNPGVSQLLKAWLAARPQHFATSISFVLMITFGMILYASYPSVPSLSAAIVYDVKKGEELIKVLEDGSSLHLNTDTVVEVLYTKKSRTIRLLRGEVYFDVAKDFKRPFEVFVGDSHVVAVGTEFDIRLDQNKLDVVVTEGKIQFARMVDTIGKTALANVAEPASENRVVTAKEVTESFLVEAGYQIRVVLKAKPSEGMSTSKTEKKEIIPTTEIIKFDHNTLAKQTAWRNGELLFVNSPLSEVISELGRYNNVDISIQPELRDLKIGGRFAKTDVDRILEALEMSANIDIQIQPDGAIFLASR